MSGDLVVQTNGPYLRVVLPDFETSWDTVWRAVDFELEEGVTRAEIVAPGYHDEVSLAAVRRIVEQLAERGVDAIVEWQGVPDLVASS
jgi:hypothetical protein